MNFNKHLELRGQHALFSPSQSSWLRYDEEKIANRVRSQYRTALGTELHEFVASQILLAHKASTVRGLVQGAENFIFTKYKCAEEGKLGAYGMTLIRNLGSLPKEVFETAKAYINDGIGFRMNVEQPLVYSEFFFGTADTICFRDNTLRIHDYKSGEHPASMEQLFVYAALFCLEYNIDPNDILTELRIYQNSEVVSAVPEKMEIRDIADKIVRANSLVEKIKAKED
jgi:hypothetical protein